MHHVLFSGTINPPSTHPLSAPLSESLYLRLLPRLHKSVGFISQVPFVSSTDPNGQLLYAVFEDEDAVMRWRTERMHLGVQRTGRETVFAGYRIRVGRGVEEWEGEGNGERQEDASGKERKEQVMLVYQRPTPTVPPAASGNEGEGEGESAPAPAPAPVIRSLKSLLDRSKSETMAWDELNDESTWQSEDTVLWMSSWKSLGAAEGFEKAICRVERDSVQKMRVLRDYGKEDRREVPETENESVEAAGDEEGGEWGGSRGV